MNKYEQRLDVNTNYEKEAQSAVERFVKQRQFDLDWWRVRASEVLAAVPDHKAFDSISLRANRCVIDVDHLLQFIDMNMEGRLRSQKTAMLLGDMYFVKLGGLQDEAQEYGLQELKAFIEQTVQSSPGLVAMVRAGTSLRLLFESEVIRRLEMYWRLRRRDIFASTKSEGPQGHERTKEEPPTEVIGAPQEINEDI